MPTPKEVQDALGRMSGMPASVTNVIAVADSPGARPAELAEAVKADPVLVFEILRLVNSAFYGVSNDVHTVQQAVVLLGFKNVKNICLTLGLGRAATTRLTPGAASERRQYWQHSVTVAILSKLIGEAGGRSKEEAEDLFLYGLLHDIGNAALTQLFPEDAARARALARDDGIAPWRAEKKVFGVSSREVGRELCERWHFPERFGIVIDGWPMPNEDSLLFRDQVTVLLANIESNRLDKGDVKKRRETGHVLDPRWFKAVHLDSTQLRRIVDEQFPPAFYKCQAFTKTLVRRST